MHPALRKQPARVLRAAWESARSAQEATDENASGRRHTSRKTGNQMGTRFSLLCHIGMYFPCFCWHCLPRIKCSVAYFLLLSYCYLCCIPVELNRMQLSTHLSTYCSVLADYMHPPVYPLTVASLCASWQWCSRSSLLCSEYIHIPIGCTLLLQSM